MKQVKILDDVNEMLIAIVNKRKEKQLAVNKQSVVNELIMATFKKECK